MGFFTFTCPVCEIKKSNSQKSNGKFNNFYICRDCIRKINAARHGQVEGYALLQDLKEIVSNNNNTINTIQNNPTMQYESLFDTVDNLDDRMKKDILLENKYEERISNHFSYLEKEDMLYSTAINLPNIDNEVTKKCLEICLKDIALSIELKDYFIKKYGELPHYPAFYYACQLYDKLGNIDEAIAIAKQAVDLNYYRDSSKGGMPARLARLLAKKSKLDDKKIYDKII